MHKHHRLSIVPVGESEYKYRIYIDGNEIRNTVSVDIHLEAMHLAEVTLKFLAVVSGSCDTLEEGKDV